MLTHLVTTNAAQSVRGFFVYPCIGFADRGVSPFRRSKPLLPVKKRTVSSKMLPHLVTTNAAQSVRGFFVYPGIGFADRGI